MAARCNDHSQLEQRYILIKESVNPHTLIKYIKDHEGCDARYDEASNKIIGVSAVKDMKTGRAYQEESEIQPTFRAVREWLGY